jgi:small subunit ribosomal protein S11e
MADGKEIIATGAVDQNEKAYQKQQNVFLGYKKLANKKVNKAGLRWTRNVGLGFKTPVTAVKVR